MADSALDSQLQSARSCLRRISSSLFNNIPGFFIGFNSKSSVDSDSARSPTSPLDFSFFSSLSNPFSLKSPTLPSQVSHQKKWEISKVGLGIINLLSDETKPIGDDLDSLLRKNIIFGPQVKAYGTVKSKSLPKNFTISMLCKTKTPNLSVYDSDAQYENKGEILGLESFEDSSKISLIPKTNSSSLDFSSGNGAVGASLPLLIASGSGIHNSLDVKSSSLPIPIESGHGNVGSLSAREIQLSEDYTCIISHGPNPKTTHIFCDCILECQIDDLPNFESTENLSIETPQEAVFHEASATYSSNEFLSGRDSCKKMVEEGDDTRMFLGENAIGSFDCRSADILSEEVAEDNFDNFCNSSPGSSYNEDLFLIGMPMET